MRAQPLRGSSAGLSSKPASSLADEMSRLIAEHSGEAFAEKDDDNPFGWVDILTFCENPFYLGEKLFPWQKLILKIFYMASPGNSNLSIMDNPTASCSHCVWSGNDLNRIGRSPCVTCEHYDSTLRERDLDGIHTNPVIRRERREKLLSTVQFDSHFTNELMLINNNLPSDSDARAGGSVSQQVEGKIGKPFSELILVLGRRSGKALALDTPIITPDGWRTMGDLMVGDLVFGSDGLPTRIVAVTDVMTDRPCYRMTFSNGDTIVCDEQHEWPTVDKLERKYSARYDRPVVPKSRTTREISDSIYYGSKQEHNHSIEVCRPLHYPDQPEELPIPPYLFGVWLGDGHADDGNISCDDPEILVSICEDGCRVSGLVKQPGRYTIRELPCGGPLLTVLKREGLWKNKHIPERYQRASIDQRLAILQGLMDTDGHVCKNGRCEITQVNGELAEDIFRLAAGLGLKVTMGEGAATIDGRYICQKYRVCFTPPNGVAVCRLERKQTKLDVKGKRKSDIGRIFIESAERLDQPVPVRCIQVDNEDHTYLAGRTCIPTHNSQMAVWIALYEIYKLIEMGNPQRLLGLTDGSLVTVLNVAVAEEQAMNAVFSKVRSAIERSPYFKTKMVPKSLRVASVKFLTPYDEERNIELEQEGFPPREGSIQFVSGNSSSSSQVGLNIPVIIIDEMASMGKDNGSSQSDAELYTALKNSVWNFPDARIICISNPLTRDGKFYELYENSFTDDRLLMFQLPSYIVNPAIPEEILEEERRQAMMNGSLTGYQMHIEARFIGGAANPLVPAVLIDEAFERGYRLARSEYGDPRQQYYLHIDPALSDDNYALAVVHVETDPLRRSDRGDLERIIFVDHIQMWSPDRVTGTPVDIATVEQYVADLNSRFNIVSITSDQWGSWSSMQNFQRRGMPARVTPFNPDYVNRIFTNMVELFVQGRIVFYQHGPFSNDAIEQWKYLQQKFSRRNSRVEAAEGHKDDIPAAVAGASYVALSGEMSFAGLPEVILVRADWDRSGNIGGTYGGQQNMGWRGTRSFR